MYRKICTNVRTLCHTTALHNQKMACEHKTILHNNSLRQSLEPDLSHFEVVDSSYSSLKHISGIRPLSVTTEVSSWPLAYLLYQRHIPNFLAYPYGKVPNWTQLISNILAQAIPHLNILLGFMPVCISQGSKLPFSLFSIFTPHSCCFPRKDTTAKYRTRPSSF